MPHLGGTVTGPEYELILNYPTKSLIIKKAPSEFRIRLNDSLSETVSEEGYLDLFKVKQEDSECGKMARAADQFHFTDWPDWLPKYHPNDLKDGIDLSRVTKAFIVFEEPIEEDLNLDVQQTCLLTE